MKIRLNGNKSFYVTDLTSTQYNFLMDFFKYSIDVKRYDYRKKTWDFHGESKDITIPEIVNISTLEFKMGYIFVVANLLYPDLDKENLRTIVDHFTNKTFSITNYYNLEDINNTYEKLNTLLKFKYGIMQIPTGSGKTEMISTIVKNILDNSESVLVISETTPVLDEIRDRLRSLGIQVPKYFDKSSPVNIIKPTGFCRNGLYNYEAKVEYFNKVKYLIADEVETTVTPTFVKLFNDLKSCEYFYGFSASANKLKSTGIPKDKSLKQILNPCVANVVSYYGFTCIDNRPRNLDILVKTVDLEVKVHPDITDRHAIIRQFFRSNKVRSFIREIIDQDKTLFVPVNDKVAFYSMIQDKLFTDTNILMISGDGYLVYNNGNKEKLSLEQLKQKVENKEIRLILGTASSYRGIDFHGIDSALITFESQSDILRQCIGRLTRRTSFEVYLIRPLEKISYLTSSYWKNYKEIKDYYELCNLKFIKV